jgi:hypothetical protein
MNRFPRAPAAASDGLLQGEKWQLSPGTLMRVSRPLLLHPGLIGKRVYKPPFPHNKAQLVILEGKGSHFDPGRVAAFIELQEAFRNIALEFADHEAEKEMLRRIKL